MFCKEFWWVIAISLALTLLPYIINIIRYLFGRDGDYAVDNEYHREKYGRNYGRMRYIRDFFRA